MLVNAPETMVGINLPVLTDDLSKWLDIYHRYSKNERIIENSMTDVINIILLMTLEIMTNPDKSFTYRLHIDIPVDLRANVVEYRSFYILTSHIVFRETIVRDIFYERLKNKLSGERYGKYQVMYNEICEQIERAHV